MWLQLYIQDREAEWVARRLGYFVSGRLAVAEPTDSGLGWRIGATNDWWLTKINESWALQFRYPQKDKLLALQTILEWILGIRSALIFPK